MFMDVRECLTRERECVCEIERVSEKIVCACVKETWTTHDKVEKKHVCLMQTYHTCIFDSRSEVRRECVVVTERSPGDRDGTTWVGDRVTRCVRDRRYPERYRDRRMDGRRQYVCS